MKRTSVYSSNLVSVGYDLSSQILEIQFPDGSVYQYNRVPQEIYINLMNADSHGQYFYAMIRNSYQYRIIGYEAISEEERIQINQNQYNDSSDYENNNDDNDYDPPLSKYDLGMDDMSDYEFDTWLEDESSD